MVEIALGFMQIDCTGCGVRRTRGVVCPDCSRKPDPREQDDQANRRRAVTQRAIELLERPAEVGTVPADSPELSALLERLGHWPRQFLTALEETCSQQPGARERLEAVVTELVTRRAEVAAIPRRRPWKMALDQISSGIDCLSGAARSWLLAVRASVPLQAQQLGEEAQQQQDRAAAAFAGVGPICDTLQEFEHAGGLDIRYDLLLRRAALEYGTSNHATLTRQARRTIRQLTGVDPSEGYGVTTAFLLQDTAVGVLGDRSRFRRVFADAFGIFSRGEGRVLALARSDDFLPDIRHAFDAVTLAAAIAMSLMEHEKWEQATWQAQVSLAVKLLEGPGQALTSALLISTGYQTESYSELRHKNSNHLLVKAREHADLRPLLEGFNGQLRNAEAHLMLRFSSHGVTLLTKRDEKYLSWEEFLDQVIAAVESAEACLLALAHMLSRHGIAVPGGGASSSFSATSKQMVVAALLHQGCRDIDVDNQDHRWTVRLTAPGNLELLDLTSYATLYLPRSVERLTIVIIRSDGIHTLDGSLSFLRAFLEIAPTDSERPLMARARMQCLWTHNGAPWAPASTLRYYAAVYGLEALRCKKSASAIAELRALRSLAGETNDHELADTLTAAIRLVRLEGSPRTRTAPPIRQLQSWIQGKAPKLPS
ncbi:hypothetical protein [Streptomyces sodiiphilus]|uniref:hypothetical protein n=1 Tax=Streptomyces sodiiphilus TaxID=226217 RepID=UPI0031CFE98B